MPYKTSVHMFYSLRTKGCRLPSSLEYHIRNERYSKGFCSSFLLTSKQTLPLTLIMEHHIANESDDSYNSYILRERQTHSRRTVIRLAFEVYCRKSAMDMNFVRLRGRSIKLSCPNADQAELVMQTIERVIAAMDGKLLTKG